METNLFIRQNRALFTELFYVVLVALHLGSCSMSKIEFVNANKVKDETLIRVYSKTQENGTIEFLKREGEKCQLLIFSYAVDVKRQTSSCSLRQMKLYEIADNRISEDWMTSSMFQKQKYYEKCFACFSEHFMEMSNDEKIRVLEEISSKIE